MTDLINALMSWARINPWPTALAVGPAAALALYLLVRATGRAIGAVRRRATVPVAMAAFGAVLATALSGDTAWRFAATYLGISAEWERALIFAIGEVSLFTFGLAARANLNDPERGSTGVPGVMVWVTCGVLAVPAIAVSDSLPAAVGRIVFGPCAAAVLWHMAMGIELRQSRPKTTRTGLLALLGTELRERTLARFGLAEGNRTAEQIIRQRAAIRVAVLAERYHAFKPTQARRREKTLRRLRKQIVKAGLAGDAALRELMLNQRAHLQHAAGPAELPSPWEAEKTGVEMNAPRVNGGEGRAATREPVNVDPAVNEEGREPVNATDEVNADRPVKSERPEPVDVDPGVNVVESRAAAAFTPPSAPASLAYGHGAVNTVEPHPQHGPSTPYGTVHPSLVSPPFTQADDEDAQVTGVNTEVKGHPSPPVNGQSEHASIGQSHERSRVVPGWSAAPKEAVRFPRATREVNDQGLVPSRTGTVKSERPEPVNAPRVNGGEGRAATREPVNVDPAVNTDERVNAGQADKISAEEARKIIEEAWWGGILSNAETAQAAQRAPSYVSKIWGELKKDHGERPTPEQAQARR